MGDVPAWWGKDRERINDRSRAQERSRAAEVGGRTSAGSGSSWRSPGDVRAEEYLEELKFTDKKSYSLRVTDWNDIKEKALSMGREPRMVIEFPEYDLRLVVTEE